MSLLVSIIQNYEIARTTWSTDKKASYMAAFATIPVAALSLGLSLVHPTTRLIAVLNSIGGLAASFIWILFVVYLSSHFMKNNTNNGERNE